MINKKKKKGFTLIELIAVIAILAILGVILVPKLSGYSTKANRSTDLSNAKAIIQAVELYNLDNPNAQLAENVTLGTATTGVHAVIDPTYLAWPKNPKSKYGSMATTLSDWDDLTIDTLRKYATALED